MATLIDVMNEASWKVLPKEKALLRACEFPDELDRVKDLIEVSQVSVNVKDDRDRTPLHHCSWRDCHKTVAYLLLVGADINEQDVNGRTPLHMACRHGQVDSVRYLAKHGADKTIKDHWGKVPGEVFDPRITEETQDTIRAILSGEDDLSKHIASKHIQRLFRGYKSRRTTVPMLEEMRDLRLKEEEEALQLREEWARQMSALSIQGVIRSHLARKRVIEKWVERNAPEPVVKKNETLQPGILYGDDKRKYEATEIEVPADADLLFVGISGHFSAFGSNSPLPGSPKSHTEYHVQVQCDDATPHQFWRVCRRYHDFDKLYNELRKLGFALPDLPPKRLFGQMEHEFVIQRQGELEKWLDKVIENSAKFASYTKKDCQEEESFREFMTKNPETVVEGEEHEGGEDYVLADAFTDGGADIEKKLKFSKNAIARPLSYQHGQSYVRNLCRDQNVNLESTAVERQALLNRNQGSVRGLMNRAPSQRVNMPDKNKTGSFRNPNYSPRRRSRRGKDSPGSNRGPSPSRGNSPSRNLAKNSPSHSPQNGNIPVAGF